MKNGGPEHRRQTRYPLRTEAIIERHTGEKVPASTVNVSGGGVLLELAQESGLRIGETVTCGVRLYECKSLQSWGSGRVVRVEKSLVAIDFHDPTPEMD